MTGAHEVTAEPVVKMDGGVIGYRFLCSCGREGKGHHRTAERAIERGHDHFLVPSPSTTPDPPSAGAPETHP